MNEWQSPQLMMLMLSACIAGCAANFKEVHHFSSSSLHAEKERATNYFRLTVEGKIRLSKGRYVSGYYDERAVDLMFNEIKSSNGKPAGIPRLFEEEMKDPGSKEVIKPLSPDDEHGALVLILSTDATSVANAIGSFAESEAVADTLVSLLNSQAVAESNRTTAKQAANITAAQAAYDELVDLFKLVKTDVNQKDFEHSCLRILNAIASNLEPGTHLESLDDARVWFSNRPRN